MNQERLSTSAFMKLIEYHPPVEEINLNGVMHLFQNINKEEIQGPNGEIDVLIGFEYTSYHPEREQSSGHLILFKNRCGRCLGGSHANMADNTLKLIQHATVHQVARVNMEDFSMLHI